MAIDRHETAAFFSGTALSAALHVAALVALFGFGAGHDIPAEPLSMVVEVVVEAPADAADGMSASAGSAAIVEPSVDPGSKAEAPPSLPPTSMQAQTAEPPTAPRKSDQTGDPPPATLKPVRTAVAPAPSAPPRAKRTPPQAAPPTGTASTAATLEAPAAQRTQQAALEHSGAGPALPPKAESQADNQAGIGDHVGAAALIANPAPTYPLVARRRGIEGKVVLLVAVTAAGNAGDVSILSSSGHESLDAAAARAVLAWRFRPAQQRGAPVNSVLEVPIVFRLVTDAAPVSTSQAGAAE